MTMQEFQTLVIVHKYGNANKVEDLINKLGVNSWDANHLIQKDYLRSFTNAHGIWYTLTQKSIQVLNSVESILKIVD